MKYSVPTIGILLIILNIQCTGWNLFRWATGAGSHTSPTPEYSSPNAILKGGLIIHRNTISGGVGQIREGKLYRGEACSWSALWLVAGGDSGLREAKKNAGIDFIHSVEYKQESTLGFFYHQFCTIVVGMKDPEKEGSYD